VGCDVGELLELFVAALQLLALLGEGRFSGPALGDVVNERREETVLPLPHRRDRHLDRELGPVAMQRRELQAPALRRPDAAGEQVAVLRRDDPLDERFSDRLGAGPTERLLRLRVPIGDAAVRINRHERVVSRVDDQAQPLGCLVLGFMLGAFGPLSGAALGAGDVPPAVQRPAEDANDHPDRGKQRQPHRPGAGPQSRPDRQQPRCEQSRSRPAEMAGEYNAQAQDDQGGLRRVNRVLDQAVEGQRGSDREDGRAVTFPDPVLDRQ
jgi:hypothetical protein